jgi:hypothetical protein
VRLVVEPLGGANQVIVFFSHREQTKAAAPFALQIYAAIGQKRVFHDFRCAADRRRHSAGKTFHSLDDQRHTEGSVAVQHAAHHQAIARLEDVER